MNGEHQAITRIVRGGVIHVSRGQRTTNHAHYAWKLHIGLDAPVWVRSAGEALDADAGARVVVVPPGVQHSTGAMGWSCAVFIAPGTRGSPWRTNATPSGLGGPEASRLIAACKGINAQARASTSDFISELAHLARGGFKGSRSSDARAEAALRQLRLDPDLSLSWLAAQAGNSLDRLSRLVTGTTGVCLRSHALWYRLLRLLSSNTKPFPRACGASSSQQSPNWPWPPD